MAQIQRSVAEPDKRNIFSRILNPNKDKETIVAWRSDLDRIVHVFEVCSTIHSLPILLTVHLQRELALHTHIAVTDIREDVGDIRGGVGDIREDIANTHELVSDMHRTLLKGQEGVDGMNQTVGKHGVLFMIQKFLQLPQTRARFAISTVVVDPGPYF